MLEIAIVSGLVGMVIGHVLTRLRDLRLQVDRIHRLEAKLDALMAQNGIDFNPMTGVDPAVADALTQGKTILAIYHYRKATGAGLKEAKDAVEGLQCRMTTLH